MRWYKETSYPAHIHDNSPTPHKEGFNYPPEIKDGSTLEHLQDLLIFVSNTVESQDHIPAEHEPFSPLVSEVIAIGIWGGACKLFSLLSP